MPLDIFILLYHECGFAAAVGKDELDLVLTRFKSFQSLVRDDYLAVCVKLKFNLFAVYENLLNLVGAELEAKSVRTADEPSLLLALYNIILRGERGSIYRDYICRRIGR